MQVHLILTPAPARSQRTVLTMSEAPDVGDELDLGGDIYHVTKRCWRPGQFHQSTRAGVAIYAHLAREADA